MAGDSVAPAGGWAMIPAKKMNRNSETPPSRIFNREAAAALAVTLLFSLLSFAYVYSQHATDLDGDGWSHVKNARLLTDSINSGYEQIGTVWLPLFHLLAAPLAMNNFLWRTGLAGSAISMASFVTAGLGLFLILKLSFRQRAVAWLGLTLFLMNPSLLYYQTTPMQEPLSMALLVVNVLLLILWKQRSEKRHLVLAAFLNALAALNRYDGWFFIPFGTLWVLVAAREDPSSCAWKSRFKDGFVYGFIASLGPVYWLAHNGFMYGDALYFLHSPDSARALYLRQIATFHFRYPTDGHWWLSLLYFTKSMRYCAGEIPFWLGVAGFAVVVVQIVRRQIAKGSTPSSPMSSASMAPLLFLVPFIFYVLSLATGRAPTYVVDYYPYTNFGIRYGHTPIPAVITLACLVFEFIAFRVRTLSVRRFLAMIVPAVLVFPLILAVKTELHSLPAHEEPYTNNYDDRRLLRDLARYLKPRWHGEMILMRSGYLGRIPQLDEIPYRRVFFEGNLSQWEFIRRYPFPGVTWVFAEEGDDIWEMVRTIPAYQRYYREEWVIRGAKAHIIHVYRHHAPVEPAGEPAKVDVISSQELASP